MVADENLPTLRSARKPHVDAVRSTNPGGGATPPADRPDTLALYFDARRHRARAVGDLLLVVARALSRAAMCSNLLERSTRRGSPSPTTGDPGWHDDSSRSSRLHWRA